MKQGLNKFLWPCMSVTMYNDMEQVCVGCEGIVCSKGDESYIAMTNFMISNSPKRKRENIHVVAADGFVTQDTVSEKFEIPDSILWLINGIGSNP